MSSLNGELAQEELFRNVDGIPITLLRDVTRNSNYLVTNTSVFAVSVAFLLLSFCSFMLFVGDCRLFQTKKIVMFGQLIWRKP
jgi:hypothetical protein